MTSTTTAPNLQAPLQLRGRGFWGSCCPLEGRPVKKTERTNLASVRSATRGGSSNGTSNAYASRFGMTERPALGSLLDLACAPGGDWLADLEGDGDEAVDSLETLLGGEVIETRGWRSTRGSHNLFIVDGDRLLSLLQAAGAEEGEGNRVRCVAPGRSPGARVPGRRFPPHTGSPSKFTPPARPLSATTASLGNGPAVRRSPHSRNPPTCSWQRSRIGTVW